MSTIKIDQNIKGHNQGYCKICDYNFKKNDFIIYLDKCKINKIIPIKMCSKCFLSPLGDKMGWINLMNLIHEIIEAKI